jgi:hypothetical protein
MTASTSKRDRANKLMRDALSLLDDAGEFVAAVHLEQAIDALDEPAWQGGGEQSIPPLIAPKDPVMARALGGALAVIGTVLHRSGVVEIDELARLLGIFATVTSERDPASGTLIAGWGGMMMDLSEDFRKDGDAT